MTDATLDTAADSTKDTTEAPTTNKPLTDDGHAAQAKGSLKTLIDRVLNRVTGRH